MNQSVSTHSAKPAIDPRAGDALIVVDVQRDFLPGGALGVERGDEVVERLNDYMRTFSERRLPVILTRDWHPADHCSFVSVGGRWPPHCVQETPGAQWPGNLAIPAGAHIISKGAESGAEAYSGFSGTTLLAVLRGLEVRRVFVGGLATDYCVHATVIDARANGLEVIVLADAVRGVNATPGDETRALNEMVAHGATIFQPDQAQTSRAVHTP